MTNNDFVRLPAISHALLTIRYTPIPIYVCEALTYVYHCNFAYASDKTINKKVKRSLNA